MPHQYTNVPVIHGKKTKE